MNRHYGLDWLRIGAFALLIFYHIGMVFVPWDFHVKTAHPADWVALPMLITNSWRLLLLFLVSGYASRALLAKDGHFLALRSKRLLVPLLFGIIIVVPVQPWIELMTQHGYARGFGYFYFHDYFRFAKVGGILLPTWNHLWFVGYLWIYTVVLAIGVFLFRARPLQPLFDRVFGGPGLLIIPVAWLLFVDLWLLPGGQETHDLITDSLAHLHYLPGFLIGFGLARSKTAMAGMLRWWRPAVAVAILAYGVSFAIQWQWPGDIIPPKPFGEVFAVAHLIQGWATIIALIGIAERYWNHDHPARAMLTEAVFPFYLIHQTIIVFMEWVLLPYRLSPWMEFAVLAVTTVAGCWAFYLIGRRIGPLRPLIGLRRHSGKAIL